VSAVGQNEPATIGINGLKTSSIKESETSPFDWLETGALAQSRMSS